jgi:hypothetical protein
MNDLQRVRAWLLDQKEKRMLNALAEAIRVDRRTMQRIINQPDYHPRFDTLQVLLDTMDKDGKKRAKTVKPAVDDATSADSKVEDVAAIAVGQLPVGGKPINVESTEFGPHATIRIHPTKES